MKLISYVERSDRLDHTDLIVEMSAREVALLARLLGASSGDVSEALGLYSKTDGRPAHLWRELMNALEEVGITLDEYVDGTIIVATGTTASTSDESSS